MKQGLELPTTIHHQLDYPKATEKLAGEIKRIAMFAENNKSFHIMLDKWKQSGHTVKSGEALILNIRGRK